MTDSGDDTWQYNYEAFQGLIAMIFLAMTFLSLIWVMLP